MSESDGLAETDEETAPVSQAFIGLSDIVINAIYENLVIPTSLFHYTSAQGLLGIIGENKLWFSDAAFMNDGSESTYGVVLAGTVIDDLLADSSAEEKNAGNALKSELAVAMNAFQPAIFCMSERNNLLNQWRDYGKDIVPYSIELDVQSIMQNQYASFPAFLTKIVYDETIQKQLIRQLLQEIRTKALEIRGDRPLIPESEAEPLLRGAAAQIVNLVSRFKNPAFAAEEEWRAICFRPLMYNIAQKFRQSSLGVVPYYEWMVSGGKSKLPIKSATVGPSPYAQVSDLALKQFLYANDYQIPTYYSTIPLRR
ncbi:DUF2971 domain-containing protein [Rhizobium sp.]|uniref:DUF2971 domain-containing protein n=1 Tax=Rhizobium sp. TaxID=391 RepID=UPI0034C5C776